LYPQKNLADRLFVHYAFTIYLAWTLFITILNFWIEIPAINTVINSTIVIICLGLVGLFVVDCHKRADFIFSATIAWALIGIAMKQYETFPILITASLFFGWYLRVWVRRVHTWWRPRNKSKSETDPLIR